MGRPEGGDPPMGIKGVAMGKKIKEDPLLQKGGKKKKRTHWNNLVTGDSTGECAERVTGKTS